MDALEKLQSSLTGRYAVVREVGAGGMATVFLARDVKHDRHVALKVLRPELGAVLGVERFLSEIKVTAHLQHPHLLPLFDSGEVEGLLFYVMPFVEGQSLRARLDIEQQLPIDEALRLTLAVASALEYAHKQGVIHRDLKPENILLQHGEPVVSDFGIALAVSKAGGARVTQTGLSLGTPQYMSPEQATGDRVVDARSDIYSLAAVLYEMLTGEPPHAGKTAQAIIARVLTEKTHSMRVTRDTIPEHIDAAVLKALAKLPADRFASVAEFAAALKNPAFGTVGAGASGATASSGGTGAYTGAGAGTTGARSWPSRAVRSRWLLGILGVGAGVAAAIWGGLGGRRAEPGAVVRFNMSLPAAVGFGASASALAISNDGSAIIVGALQQRDAGLSIRTLDNPKIVSIPGTSGASNVAFFSPDGASIGFIKGGAVMTVPRAGGPVVSVATGANASFGATWGEGGQIVYGTGSINAQSAGGLWIVSASGGTPRSLTLTDSSQREMHSGPSFLPGGKAVVFAIVPNNTSTESELAVATLDGKITRLGQRGGAPRYTDDGHLVFFDQLGTVFAVPFSLGSLKITGAAVPLMQSVSRRSGLSGQWAVSRNGTLVSHTGTFASTLLSVDRNGTATPLFPETRGFRRPRVSPDGRKIVIEIGNGGAATGANQVDLWMLDRASGGMSRFTFGAASSDPQWTHDGERVAYARHEAAANSVDIFWQPADGSGAAEPMLEAPGNQFPYGFTPDDKTLILSSVGGGRLQGIRTFEVGAKDTKPLIETEFSNRLADMSADGKWIAYASNESGRYEIYVRPFPGPGGKWAVSTNAGDEPLWNPNGRELFYRDGTNVMVATVTTSPTFSVVSRKVLFEDLYDHAGTHDWHIFPDGNHFAMLRPVQSEAELTVTLNALAGVRAAAKK